MIRPRGLLVILTELYFSLVVITVIFNKAEFLPFAGKEDNSLILEADLKLVIWLLPSMVTWDTLALKGCHLVICELL